MSVDVPLLSESDWREECAAVVRDVGQFVSFIRVSEKLEVSSGDALKVAAASLISFSQSSSSCVYLNITTLEDRLFTVELTARGFRVVASGSHDLIGKRESEVGSTVTYETPYSLLQSISQKFSGEFGRSLQLRLEALAPRSPQS